MKETVKALAVAAAVVTGGNFSALAAEPRAVEYIESNWAKKHFIDLGVSGRSGLEVESTLSWLDFQPDGCYLGARTKDGTDSRCFFINNSGFGGLTTHGWYYGYKTLVRSTRSAVKNLKYTLNAKFVDNRQTLTLDGETIAEGAEADGFDCGCNLYLFAANYSGTVSLAVSARCYGVKIWDYTVEGHEGERTLIRDFVPYLDANGKPCLYETLSEEYYYPGSSDKNLRYGELPAPDAPTVDHYVEYIESDGSQIVHTGIYGGTGCRATCDVALTAIPKDGCLFGVISGTRIYFCYYYNSTFCWANGGSVTQPLPAVPATVEQRYSIEMKMFTDYRAFYVDGQLQSGPFNSDSKVFLMDDLCLFARNNAGKKDYPTSMRCYGAQVFGSPDGKQCGKDEEVLVLDLHPCVDTAGKPGLYDSVSGRILYDSAGGNAFEVGPTIAEAGVVVRIDGPSFAAVNPEPGTYSDLEAGKSYDYTSEELAYDEWMVYACQGYTTATSEDGSTWGDESALVDSRSCTHVYDGSWWRLTWKWPIAGYIVSNVAPAGASVAYEPAAERYGGAYYPTGTEVTLTASETDGNGRRFNCWCTSVADSEPIHSRTLTVVADKKVFYTAFYSGAWTLVGEKAGVKTVTDGTWTVEVEDGIVGAITTQGGGKLDFTTIESDLGFKVTGFKNWTDNSHVGPKTITEVIAPDATDAGAHTFQECPCLRRAVFSPRLNHVGRSVFYNCRGLTNLVPDVSTFLNQTVLVGDELFAFSGCSKLTGDLVVSWRTPQVIPTAYFMGTGFTSIDFSGCRKPVSFLREYWIDRPEVETDNHGAFNGCSRLVSITFPPQLQNTIYAMFWGCSSLKTIRFTGVMPSPSEISYFYGYESYKATIELPRALNPNIVADLQLRAPTEQEMQRSTFPRAAYEKGDFIGVWDQPTSGWGPPGPEFKVMWVVNRKPPSGDGMKLLIR